MSNENFYTFLEYMKENRLTISEEDYLEMIYRLCQDRHYTRVNDLSQALNVKPPSVSSMIKRLTEKQLITHHDYGTIELTNEGKKIGQLLLKRHYIIEQFLIILNVKEKLLEEVEKIEHTFSEETLSLLQILVHFFNDHPFILEQFKYYQVHYQVE